MEMHHKLRRGERSFPKRICETGAVEGSRNACLNHAPVWSEGMSELRGSISCSGTSLSAKKLYEAMQKMVRSESRYRQTIMNADMANAMLKAYHFCRPCLAPQCLQHLRPGTLLQYLLRHDCFVKNELQGLRRPVIPAH